MATNLNIDAMGSSTTNRTRIVLLCNAEHGQANIPLAIAHELLIRDNIEVHLCSFPNLRERFDDQLRKHGEAYGAHLVERAYFHDLKGPTVTEVFLRSAKRGPFHAAGFRGCIQGLSNVFEDYWGWEETEYVDTYTSCRKVLENVDPGIFKLLYKLLCMSQAFFFPEKVPIPDF